MIWTKDKLAALPIEQGFYLRGQNMTRIETFVAAAFAFSITLIMISGDHIPTTIPETQQAMLSIPAFLFSGAQLIWIWFAHATWSKRYGLEDGKSIMLSGLLTMLVLVYIYPMRMLASALFSWISGGYFKSDLVLRTFDELRFLFYFSAAVLLLLAVIFYLMNRHVINLRKQLQLTDYEVHRTVTEGFSWILVMVISTIVFVLSAVASEAILPFVPTLFGVVSPALPLLHKYRRKTEPPL